jgi:rRNA processing protein Gar1
VEDLGPPIAYTVLDEGTPVFDPGGKRIGVVERVMGDMQLDIFEGVILHTRPLPGRHLYADMNQIAELHERGVVLTVTRDELHEPPDEAKRKQREDSGERVENPLEARLRRAWDWLTQRRAGD